MQSEYIANKFHPRNAKPAKSSQTAQGPLNECSEKNSTKKTWTLSCKLWSYLPKSHPLQITILALDWGFAFGKWSVWNTAKTCTQVALKSMTY
eukprot:655899-Amphidinium_carterae.1